MQMKTHSYNNPELLSDTQEDTAGMGTAAFLGIRSRM